MSEVPTWTLKEIWLFDKTMTHGSLTAAAFDLNMTQSAASRILASLEAKLGMTLFDRIGRNLYKLQDAFFAAHHPGNDTAHRRRYQHRRVGFGIKDGIACQNTISFLDGKFRREIFEIFRVECNSLWLRGYY